MTAGDRTLVFWVPDWPVHAFLREKSGGDEDSGAAHPPAIPGAAQGATEGAPEPPLALIADRTVVACSPSARAEGVQPGIREREAQARCPALATHPHDPEVDERHFAPVLAAIEALIPGIEPRTPGLCAMRARGPARYYGSEERAASALLELAASLGYPGTRIGIADGVFAAEQAARSHPGAAGIAAPLPGLRVVPVGGSPAFLSPLPVDSAAGPALTSVLLGLGIRTLGALAALPEDAVAGRFGPAGVAVHRAATGSSPGRGAEIRPRTPPRELAVELAFEPPIDTAEQLGFACSGLAERFVSGLAADSLVCTALRVELTDDTEARHEREWVHPRRFTAADVVGRVRWQAAASARDTGRGGAGIARVRITPVHTDRASAHEPGLWSAEPDERIHHHLSRAQSRLGHTGVGTAELTGGRLLADRQRFLPWGTAHAAKRRGRSARSASSRGSSAGPWPGALAGPLPSRIFPEPLPAELLDCSGSPVSIDSDDLLTSVPARLRVGRRLLPAEVDGWSLPWAIRERWWSGAPERFRLQLRLTDGDAWLLLYEPPCWRAEGRYD